MTVSAAFGRWLRRMTEPAAENRFVSARKALENLERRLENQTQLSLSSRRKPTGRSRRSSALNRRPPTGLTSLKWPAPLIHIPPGTILMAGGLGLIVLGGCFLIGVMTMLITPQTTFSPLNITFLATLYGMAFICFGGAWWLIAVALKNLR